MFKNLIILLSVLISTAYSIERPFTYDICYGPRFISAKNTSHGYISSPSYPEYYGNNRDCTIKILLHDSYRLSLHLIHMNVEGIGWISRRPKDYLKISYVGDSFFGSQSFRSVIDTTKDVELSFRSDFITIRQIPYPKGFLLYFTAKPLPTRPTTTSTTTTISTTPSVTITSKTTTTSAQTDGTANTSATTASHSLYLETDPLEETDAYE